MNTKTLSILILLVILALAACTPATTPALPTATALPPTITPIPPSPSPVPPTFTPVPPTDTPVPPSATPVPPTETPLPTATATQTSIPWSTASPTPIPWSPSGRIDFGMAYASKSNQVILFGGVDDIAFKQANNQNDTWIYDVASETWREMKPSVSPFRRQARLVYDAESDRTIQYCGVTNLDSGGIWDHVDTWAYDQNANTWTQMKAQGPIDHFWCEMAYDSESDRIILFGGWNFPKDEGFQETWAYDYNTDTWTDMKPAVSPPGRNAHMMVYDSKADRIIMWGGGTSSSIPEDKDDRSVWAYDYNTNTWEEKASTTGPAPRWWPAGAYHEGADRTIIYGGSMNGMTDMWAYDYNQNSWTQLNPSVIPGKLSQNAMVYLPGLDRLFLFGGFTDFKYFLNLSWLYDYSANTWTKVFPKP
jgi:hypothetical protein